MKFKKALVALLGVGFMALTGCSKKCTTREVKEFDWFGGHTCEPEAPALEKNKGSKEGREKAVKAAKDKTLCYNTRGTAMIADKLTDFSADENQFMYLVTKITVKVSGEEYICDIKWSYDSNDASFKKFRYYWDDQTHAQIDLNYQNVGEADRTFLAQAQIVCGDVTGDTVNYWANLKAPTLIHDPMTLSEVLALNTEGTNYNIVDPVQDYYKPNHEQKYLYAAVSGKVIYCAPDGNWGLIADGNHYLEIYAGAGTALKEDFYPALASGYVTVYGNFSIYKGNMQMGFIYRIEKLEDPSKIVDPSSWAVMNAQTYAAATQYTDGWYNGLFKTEGAKYNGNIKDENGTATTAAALKDKRFTFEIKLGEKVVTVAYDYHVDRDVTDQNPGLGIFNAFKAKLGQLQIGQDISLKGTVRYVSTSGNFKNIGAWQITPFLQDHIA